MDFETIIVSVEANVGRLTLIRPDRLNSFTVQMHQEVRAALDQIVDGGARCLLLTGAGRGFCAGQDLSDARLLRVMARSISANRSRTGTIRWSGLSSASKCRSSLRSMVWPRAQGPISR